VYALRCQLEHEAEAQQLRQAMAARVAEAAAGAREEEAAAWRRKLDAADAELAKARRSMAGLREELRAARAGLPWNPTAAEVRNTAESWA
jgi:hypothetical protein